MPASGSGMASTLARWNLQLLRSPRRRRATSSAASLASTQCSVPTRSDTKRAQRPLPQPASNPTAFAGNSAQGKMWK